MISNLHSLFENEVSRFSESNFQSESILCGRVVRIVGLTIEAKGISAPLGAHCQIESAETNIIIDAEVVGFENQVLYLMSLVLLKN